MIFHRIKFFPTTLVQVMILHIFANEQSGCWLIHYYGHTKRLIIEAQNMHMQVQYMPKRLWVKEVKKQPWSKI